jgi:hypothetical protein
MDIDTDKGTDIDCVHAHAHAHAGVKSQRVGQELPTFLTLVFFEIDIKFPCN